MEKQIKEMPCGCVVIRRVHETLLHRMTTLSYERRCSKHSSGKYKVKISRRNDGGYDRTNQDGS